jgi:hypothetical protein
MVGLSRWGQRLVTERARLAAEDPADAASWALPWDRSELELVVEEPPSVMQGQAMGDAELALALGINWNRSRGVIRCPAHDDAKPSLSYEWTASGRLLLHCFAGCTTPGPGGLDKLIAGATR